MVNEKNGNKLRMLRETNLHECHRFTFLSKIPQQIYHERNSSQKYISYCVCNHDHYLIQKPVVKATYRRFTEADYRNYLRRQNQ